MIATHRPDAACRGPSAFAAPKRVLLVEDQALLRWYAAEVLSDAGFEVVEAPEAASAFRLLVRERFDLLVTDIDLGPGPDGFELARYATLAHPGLPVIYASGRSGVAAEDRAVGSRFVAKPFAPAELLDAATALLDNKREKPMSRFA